MNNKEENLEQIGEYLLYRICRWKVIAETETTLEGRLKHCKKHCNGHNYQCAEYDGGEVNNGN